jgi:ATP-dependent Clp protease ATP-binding subunit ClpC
VQEGIKKIIDLELSKLYSRLENLGYHIDLTEEAKDFIVSKGWDKDFGARPLKRAIQKYIEDLLADMLVNKQIHEGESLLLDLNEAKDGLQKKMEKTEKA